MRSVYLHEIARSRWNGIGIVAGSAMRWLFCCVVVSVLIPARLDAQTSDPSSTPLRSVETVLEEMVRDEWVPADRDPPWLTLQHFMTEELKQRPHAALAELIRRAAARVDVQVSNAVVRRSDQVNIRLDADQRFELDVPIAYVVQVHASVDGGEWFLLGRARGGSGCGTSRNIVASRLKPGFHRMQLAADVSFLRDSANPSVSRECEIAGDRNAALAGTLDPEPETVIHRERRVLPAVSFGIVPDLLGASNVLASTLETGLPEVPLSQWLDSVFDSVPESRPIPRESWTVDFCSQEEASVFMGAWLGGWRSRSFAARRRPRNLCVDVGAGLPGNRMMSLRLRVGTLHEDAGVWSLEAPAFHDLSLGGSGNVMDVPFLGLLPRVLTWPAGAFPSLDVSVDARDIRYEPADAKPGDPITITATVRNVGGRDAPMNGVVIGLQSIPPASAPVALHFADAIPLDSSVSVSLQTTMPASGTIVVWVQPFTDARMFRQGPYSQLIDVDPENNLATKPIGLPQQRQ